MAGKQPAYAIFGLDGGPVALVIAAGRAPPSPCGAAATRYPPRANGAASRGLRIANRVQTTIPIVAAAPPGPSRGGYRPDWSR